MGKEVLRPTCKMNLLLSCFSLSALYTVQYLSTPDHVPAGPASLLCRTQSRSLYCHAACTRVESWFNSQRRQVGPTPFSYLGMLFIYMTISHRLKNKNYSRNLAYSECFNTVLSNRSLTAFCNF